MADGTLYTNIGDLKEQYAGDVRDQLQEKAYIWDNYLEVADRRIQGAGLNIAARVGGNMGIQAQNETEALAPPQHQRKVKPKVLPKIYTGTLEITNLARKMAGNDTAAFAAALDDDIMYIQQAMRKRLNIDFWLDGKVKHGSVVTGATSATQAVTAAWVFMPFGVYDHYDSTLATRKNAGLIVQSRTIAGSNVVFDRSVTTVTGDVFVPQGEVVSAPSDGKAITGMTAIVDTTLVATTYLTVNRSTYEPWQGNILDAGAVSMSEDLLQQAEDRVVLDSGEEVTDIWSHHLQRRNYITQLTPQKRFAGTELKGGFSALDFNGKAWMVDVDAPRDKIWLLGRKPKMYYTPDGELGLSEADGRAFKQRDGYPSTYGFIEMYGNLACDQPNANIVIYNLSVPTV